MKTLVRSFWLVSLVCVLLPGSPVPWSEPGAGIPAHAASQTADVYLETTRSELQKIPIRIMGLGDGTIRQCNPTTIEGTPADVLRADLQRTQLFTVIGQSAASPELSQSRCLETESIAEAGMDGAMVVTWGSVYEQNDKLIMDVCARDRGGKTIGKEYRGSPPSRELQRRMTHRWADELVKYYTGETGVAQTEIVYVAGDRTGGRSLYVMDYDGHGSRPVTETRNLALMPTWLPDRRSVVYTIYRQHDQEIVQLDLDSGTMDTVVPRKSLNITPAFSPDGQLIAYASATEGNSNIFIVNVQTKEKRQVTFHRGADLSPTWSPDGRSLAFMSDRRGKPQIYTMRADGSRVRRLTFVGSYNAAPAWSPRGDWIVYVCHVPPAGFRLCRITPDGQRRGQITHGSRWAMEDSPSWAPDGRHLVFSSKHDGQSHLYRIHVDGTGRESLTMEGQHYSSPSWSPFYDRVVPCRPEAVMSSAG